MTHVAKFSRAKSAELFVFEVAPSVLQVYRGGVARHVKPNLVWVFFLEVTFLVSLMNSVREDHQALQCLSLVMVKLRELRGEAAGQGPELEQGKNSLWDMHPNGTHWIWSLIKGVRQC